MRILTLEDQPFAVLPYWNAASGGGTVRAGLPVLRAVVDRLPQGLSGLLVASDLQGVVDVVAGPRRGERVLLGEALAEWLDDADDVDRFPVRGELGVLLAGDLYSAPGGNVRGATTDLDALRREVDTTVRKVESLVDEVNRKWPFARDTEIKLK